MEGADDSIGDGMAHHLELLACVARSDGDVSVEEALAIRSFMHSAGTSVDDVQRVSILLDMKADIDVEAVLQRLASECTAWSLAEAIRDAYIIASADGEVTNHEISTVERLFELLELPMEHRAKLHRWARNAASQQLLGMTFISASLDHVRTSTDSPLLHDDRVGSPSPSPSPSPSAAGGAEKRTPSMRIGIVKRSVHEIGGDKD